MWRSAFGRSENRQAPGRGRLNIERDSKSNALDRVIVTLILPVLAVAWFEQPVSELGF